MAITRNKIQLELDWYQQEINNLGTSLQIKRNLQLVYDYVKDQLYNQHVNKFNQGPYDSDLKINLLRGLKESLDFVKNPQINDVFYKDTIRTYQNHSSGIMKKIGGLMMCLYGAVCFGLGISISVMPTPAIAAGVLLATTGFGAFGTGLAIYNIGANDSKKYHSLQALTKKMGDLLKSVETPDEKRQAASARGSI